MCRRPRFPMCLDFEASSSQVQCKCCVMSQAQTQLAGLAWLFQHAILDPAHGAHLCWRVRQAVCSQWGADPMARGAYSSIGLGARGGEDYDIMARPVAGRVFFAGEATTRRYPATMHGAFLSGLWAVRALLMFGSGLRAVSVNSHS